MNNYSIKSYIDIRGTRVVIGYINRDAKSGNFIAYSICNISDTFCNKTQAHEFLLNTYNAGIYKIKSNERARTKELHE
jgi:D-aminopeptidase